MKQIFSALSLLFLAACSPQAPESPTKNIEIDSSAKVTAAPNNPAPSDDEINQDSLRNIILQSKENAILKESFLQELYIRNIVTAANDSVYFDIPFDLHSADCGAPDCYTTSVSFAFKLGATLVFPQTIKATAREHGCVDREWISIGDYQLLEQTAEHIIYHCAKEKSTIVLFSSDKTGAGTAYYFSGVNAKQVQGKNVYNLVSDYNEDDKNAILPDRSTALTIKSYKRFIK